jgi:glycosyltransferase involved in cell wall biosynthesis|tara:strand:- start:1903 stop:3336 length:1434 start_codon:yes stop_codon:yes gene_type:complete
MEQIKLPKLKSVKIDRIKKKKILLLSDDLRMASGVGTMSREFVLGTIDKYDWVQMAGAIKHPDVGKTVDMAEAVKKETGKDGYLKIYPTNGYGDPAMLRQVMEIEKPDAIMHYTDPRFWTWLYEMEHEIRQNIPIFYYNIWDDWPAPQYNENFYECSDLIMNISKQTVAIVNDVAKNKPRTDWDCTYIPHGINEKFFYPITDEKELLEMRNFKQKLIDKKPYDFILLYVNRNIRRKMTSDCITAFNEFRDRLPENKKDRVAYIMHTQPSDQNGTDLPRMIRHLYPDLNVFFSTQKLDDRHMNFLYNLSDVTMNLASNEGFGLGTCESLMAGTPIIVNVTGGLQDQCGFRLKDKLLTPEDYKEIKSLHDWRKWENNKDLTHGEWVKPVWPRTRSMMGSVPTPYIMDDRCDWMDAADKLKEWYDMGADKRTECGIKGHEFVTSDDANMSARAMCGLFIDHMETAFEKWTPREKINIYKA